jgi:hypothetical protein
MLDYRTTRLGRPQAAPFVSEAACVHRIPPRVNDDREPPLCEAGQKSI